MASDVKLSVSVPGGAWPEAARLVARWFSDGERVDRLLEKLPAGLTGVERGRCQHLVMGVVRHAGRLEAGIARLVAHPPRFITRAALYVAGFELLEAQAAEPAPDDEGRVPKVVHHAVEQTRALASPAESRMVNAVLRRLDADLRARPAPPRLAPAGVLAEYYSHPVWLVGRWLAQFGAEATRALLDWNQTPGTVMARLRPGPEEAVPAGLLRPTRWPGYVEVAPGRWVEVEPLLKSNRIHPQDPSARLSVELLAPRPGEAILDACAAPGGKSLLIADTMAGQQGPTGRLVALDLPGERIDRLRANLAQVRGVEVTIVEGDALRSPAALLKEKGLPAEYAGVLVDAPCSNTGVMRHRVDVKWRLQDGDFRRHARQQGALLRSCARLVAPGGRLVYATCSIDPDENEGVVAAFVKAMEGQFRLEKSVISLPWVAGHDGGCAALFRRVN
jgi:16S rRNA (cytosine967-C5)-methyltransferase